MSSFLGTLKAVSWSFFGIRKSSEFQKDVEKLNPMHLIIMAIALAIVMVAGLIGLVNFVVSK